MCIHPSFLHASIIRLLLPLSLPFSFHSPFHPFFLPLPSLFLTHIHSVIHLFDKYLLDISYVPGYVVGPGVLPHWTRKLCNLLLGASSWYERQTMNYLNRLSWKFQIVPNTMVAMKQARIIGQGFQSVVPEHTALTQPGNCWGFKFSGPTSGLLN